VEPTLLLPEVETLAAHVPCTAGSGSLGWLRDVLPAGAWAERPILVLARGLGKQTPPRIAAFPGPRIGVNTAAAWIACDIAFSADPRFWTVEAPTTDLHGAWPVFTSTAPAQPGCWQVRAQHRKPPRAPRWLADYGAGLVTGGSSGLAALALADLLGGQRSTIYLVGHVLEAPHPYACWRARYEEVAHEVARRCVVVGHSALSSVWPRGDLP
jgi:hypothetical protein